LFRLSFSLSEEVDVSFADGRLGSLRDLGIIKVFPFSVFALHVAHIVTGIDARTQMSDESAEVIKTWVVTLVRVGALLSRRGVHFGHL